MRQVLSGWSRRASLVGVIVLLVALSTPASAFRADQNLADADNALEKAEALLGEVVGPIGHPRAQRLFELHVKIAEQAIELARRQIQAAADVQDAAEK
jgi:hypothetical protein